MRLKNVLSIGFVMTAVLVLGFVYYFKLRVVRDPSDKLATLSLIKNSVQSRYAGNIDWKAAVPKESLFREDAVKTLEKSQALITFTDNAFVKLDENSIVIIRDMEGGGDQGGMPTFDIVGGAVEAFSKGKIRINTPKGSTTVTPQEGKGRIKVFVDKDKKTRISLLDGKGKTTLQAKTVEIEQGNRIDFKDELPEKTIELLEKPEVISPQSGRIFYYTGQDLPEITFAVKKKPYRLSVMIAKDPLLKESVLTGSSNDNTLKVNMLTEGEYFFAAVFVDKDSNAPGLYSPVRNFKVVKAKPGMIPETVKTPVESARVKPVEKLKSVDLQAGSVEGKVAMQRKGVSKTLTRNTRIRGGDSLKVPAGAHLELSMGREGTMMLRSGTTVKIRSVSSTSSLNQIEADLKSGTAVVKVKKRKGRDSEYTFSAKNHTVSITTMRMVGSSAKVALSSGKDGTLEILVLEGSPSVKVAGMDSNVSANKTILLRPNAKEPVVRTTRVRDITLEEGKVTKIFYGTEPPLVSYLWSGKDEKYKFQIAKRADFKKNVFVEYTDTNHFTDFSLQPGSYFWRYVAGGKPSGSNELSVIKTQSGSFETAKVAVSEDEPDRTIVFDLKPPVILLAWDKTKGASMYGVEIFTDPAYKQKIFSKIVPTLNLSFLADFFKEGKYFWRVKRYSAERNLISMGEIKTFTLKLSDERPALKVDFPLNNSYAMKNTVLTRGELLRKGSLWVNGQKVISDRAGSFTHTVKLDDDSGKIVYKVIDHTGEVSYYLRKVIIK